MKQISSWIAALTVAFWGMMAIVASVNVITAETRHAITNFVLPPLVLFSGALIAFFLRRKVRARRNTTTLEEIRIQSRQHLPGEPEDVHYVVRETRRRSQSERCGPKAAETPERPPEKGDTTSMLAPVPPENRRLES